MLNIKLLTTSLGVFGAVSFVLCVAYGAVVPDPLRMHSLLEGVLPGFHWISVSAFIIGLVESFLWGAYAGAVFGVIYNAFARKMVNQVD